MTNPGSFDLAAALERVRGRKRWLIATHDDPDPDAMAAAWVVSRLLEEELEATTTLGFEGIIGRAENRAMVEVLNIPMRPLATLDLTAFDATILVDTQPSATNHSMVWDQRMVGCVDHHAVRGNNGVMLWGDIRSDDETTSTIALGYLRERGIQVTREHATAVLYALKTDTQDFAREASDADIRALMHVFPLADHRALGAITKPRLEPAYFTTLHRALSDARMVEDVALAYLGPLLYPDLVAEMADLLARRGHTSWTLCAGVFGEHLRLSIRTTERGALAGALAHRLVGPMGGSAGGHGMTAGGRVPVGSADAGEVWTHVSEVFCSLVGRGGELQALV